MSVRTLSSLRILALTVVTMAVASSSAFAARTHLLQGAFGPGGTEETVFEQPRAVGVDQSTGQLYVQDAAAGTVRRFSSAHEPEPFTGFAPNIKLGVLTGFSFSTQEPLSEIAVSSISHDFYVVNHGSQSLMAFQSGGEPALFTEGPGKGTNQIKIETAPVELCGVAVDSSGDIYTSDYYKGVTVYAPSGKELVSIPATVESTFCNVAVDSHGVVYLEHFRGAVEKLTPSPLGLPVTPATTYSAPVLVDGNSAYGVAVDPSDDHVLVDERTGVAEYDESGVRVGVFAAAGLGAVVASEGLAVNGVSGQVYVSDTEGHDQVEVFGPGVTVPTAVTGEASNVAPTAATLNGSVNPEGLPVTSCVFDYVDDAHYVPAAVNPYAAGATVPCAESAVALGEGKAPVPVHADLTGLHNGTTYHFRLRAPNASGEEPGLDATFATPPPPAVSHEVARNLTAVEADLSAQVNPEGQETKYRFEYGTSSAYGTSVPMPDATLPAASVDVAVSVHLTGLTHDVTYHWRVTAINAAGETNGADHSFIYSTTTEALPDGRAYEMVTPTHKNAALIGDIVFGILPAVAEDGSHLILPTVQCFADAGSCVVNRETVGTPYEFARSPEGWTATALAPLASQYEQNTEQLVNAETGLAIFSIPSPPAGQDNFYLRKTDGTFTSIGPVTSPQYGLGNAPVDARVATTDMSHMVYYTVLRGFGHAWWPFDESMFTSLYEYDGLNNVRPKLVGVSGGTGSDDLISKCGTALAGGILPSASYAMSRDGDVVLFQALECGTGTGVNAGVVVPADTLYARVGGSETVALSKRFGPNCKGVGCVGSPASAALFQGASLDGSKVFFASTQRLTDEAGEDAGESAGNGCVGVLGVNGCNLYEAELGRDGEGHAVLGGLRAVSAGGVGVGGPRVQGVMALSGDGSRVYFVARGVLSGLANDQGAKARDGGENLYVYERDAVHPGGVTRFIATLSESDVGQWEPATQRANVSGGDGRFLLFTSDAQLTRDDSRPAEGGAQVFRFDAVSGSLVRVSVGENGFNDNGNAGVGDAQIAPSGMSRRFDGAGRAAPSMSADGSRVFFMSPVGLTRGALNDVLIGKGAKGQPEYAQNVYEYYQGHVFLISDGRDAAVLPAPACPSTISAVCLVGVDSSGSNVFFTSADQLVPTDTDTQLDFYDARICSSGDPCIQPPAPPLPPCLGEACHGIPATAPLSPAVPSATFNGQGNVTPALVVKKKAAQVRAEKLAKALATCRRRFAHSKKKRASCQKAARKTYRTAKKASSHDRIPK